LVCEQDRSLLQKQTPDQCLAYRGHTLTNTHMTHTHTHCCVMLAVSRETVLAVMLHFPQMDF